MIFFNNKYNWKLSKDLRHKPQTSKSVGIFSGLFRHANTRTFRFFYRLSRSAISIQRSNLQLWISSSGLKFLTQNSFVWEASYIYRSFLLTVTLLLCSTRIHIYLHRPFYSVVAGVTLHFDSGFSVNDLAGIKWWYYYYSLRLGQPSPVNN